MSETRRKLQPHRGVKGLELNHEIFDWVLDGSTGKKFVSLRVVLSKGQETYLAIPLDLAEALQRKLATVLAGHREDYEREQ